MASDGYDDGNQYRGGMFGRGDDVYSWRLDDGRYRCASVSTVDSDDDLSSASSPLITARATVVITAAMFIDVRACSPPLSRLHIDVMIARCRAPA